MVCNCSLKLLLKLDKYEYSMEVAADYKMGNLIKSVSKPNKRFEVKNRLEATGKFGGDRDIILSDRCSLADIFISFLTHP